MSKFEAELRLPCKQPYAYISVWIRGETIEEFNDNVNSFGLPHIANLTDLHTQAYDVVIKQQTGPKPGAGPEAPLTSEQARNLIQSELGGKVISEDEKAAPEGQPVKPWERKKPAEKADPNDPFANFK